MTLEERLNDIDPDELVYIGGKFSSGFFVICKGSETLERVKATNNYMQDRLSKNIENYNGRIKATEDDKDKLIAKLDELELEIADMERDLSEMEIGSDKSMILANKLNIKQDDFKYWSKRLQDIGVSTLSIKKQLEKAERNLLGFIPLEKHEVVDEYMKLYDKPLGRVLLVDGYVYGNSWYWTLDEVGKKVRIDDNE